MRTRPARSSEGSHTGFWKTLAKIGTIAAPIVAAPFTGGTSLALIGAAAGAANAKLNGAGLKGTLFGAGIGGATAGIGGGGGGTAAKGATAAAGTGVKNVAGKGFVDTLKVFGKKALEHAPEIMDAAGTIGQVSGDAAKGVMDQRNVENVNQLGYDRNALDRSRTQIDQTQTRDQYGMNRAALIDKMMQDRAQMGIDAPMARTKQAAYGDALKNVQDVNIDFNATTGALPQFNVTGGLRPSMFGANARAAGGELGRQALMALMTKSDIPAMTDVPEASPLIDLPELSQPKGSGALEKTLGGAGLIGNVLGGIGELRKKRQAPVVMSSGGNPNDLDSYRRTV